MEAAVTFVGFAASLVTLIAVVGDSAQTVHTLWSSFRDSSTNLERLSHAIAESEALLKDMQAVSDAYERVGIPQSLLSRWNATYKIVCNDFRELNMEMSKILECTKGSEITRKHLRRRVRHFFSEKVLENRCRQLSAHKADMGYIHLLMHSSYTILIGEKLQSFGQMIDTSRQENLSKLEELQDSLKSTQTDLVQAVHSELGRFRNPGAIVQAFNMVTDIPVVHRRHSPLRVKDPEPSLCCTKTRRCQYPCRQHSGGLIYAVEWHSYKYCFAIGRLQVEHVESIDVETDDGDAASVQLVACRSKRIRFTFKPPTWFSSLIMKIDIAMQIAQHGSTPSITWGPISNGKHLDPLVDELYQISNLSLDLRLLAIAEIGELDYLFEDVVSYCLGIVPYSNGKISQKQRDARPIADALEQGHISLPGGEAGSRFLTKIIIRIEGIKNNRAPGGARSRHTMPQPLSKGSVLESDDVLLDRSPGYLSETQRAIMLSLNLIGAGAQLPASIDFASILMRDHGLWYLQNICPTFDITEIADSSQTNRWIYSCLVRTVPACYESVSRQLHGFPVNALQYHISPDRLTDEINSSHESVRHRFLLSISVGGSTSMIDSLLFQGLSLGELSTYYFEQACERGSLNMAILLWSYGASLSLETSTRLLEHLKPGLLKTLFLDQNKSEVFCHFLERALDFLSPLQELSGGDDIFEGLVRIYHTALIQSKLQHDPYRKSGNDDTIPNRVVKKLLEAGLFRDSRLPVCYWSCNDSISESPMTLAIYARNTYAMRLLLKNGYNVDEIHYNLNGHCMEGKGTPLTYAIWLGFTEPVTVLLEAGAGITKVGPHFQTAAEMAKLCLSTPLIKGSAQKTSLEDRDDDLASRRRIFGMVCANIQSTYDMNYTFLIDEIHRIQPRIPFLRLADHHPPSPRYWSRAELCVRCPVDILIPRFRFTWNEFEQFVSQCPCLDCYLYSSGSKSHHSPLPGCWERIFAPCNCSFVESSDGRVRETYMGTDGIRWGKPCPLDTRRQCNFRILYINHVTGESTLQCPCATCSPDRKGVPCLTLGSLFCDEQPDSSEESRDSLVPAQDMTRVGKPCWRLGSLFDEPTTEEPEPDEDPVIPDQDVGLGIFDDMPGFALPRNHIDLGARDMSPVSTPLDSPLEIMPEEPLLTASTDVSASHLRQGDWTFKGVLASLVDLWHGAWTFKSVITSLMTTTLVSIKSCHPFFGSHTTTTKSTLFPMDDQHLFSVSEKMTAFAGLLLSVLLVIAYECVGVYVYVKRLPPPPRFLSRLGTLALMVMGLWILVRGLGLV